MSTKSVPVKRGRGRVRTLQSLAMSKNMVKLRAQGLTYQAIADRYNSEKRRAGKHLTAQAICQRVTIFKLAFPAETAEITASVTPVAITKKSRPALPKVPNAELAVAA